MRIGILAKKAGLSVRAVRYYEERGLLNPSGHSSGGFRLYGEDSLKRLELIAFLKGLDLSLAEIRQIFDARGGLGVGKRAVARLQEVFAEKLQMVESRLELLSRMKSDIFRVLQILQSCRSCKHHVLLDFEDCRDCRKLPRKEEIPELFKILLQKSDTGFKVHDAGS